MRTSSKNLEPHKIKLKLSRPISVACPCPLGAFYAQDKAVAESFFSSLKPELDLNKVIGTRAVTGSGGVRVD